MAFSAPDIFEMRDWNKASLCADHDTGTSWNKFSRAREERDSDIRKQIGGKLVSSSGRWERETPAPLQKEKGC